MLLFPTLTLYLASNVYIVRPGDINPARPNWSSGTSGGSGGHAAQLTGQYNHLFLETEETLCFLVKTINAQSPQQKASFGVDLVG